MVKRCMWGTCKSDTRYQHRPSMAGVIFYPFPKPITRHSVCLRWLAACGKPPEKLNVNNVRKFHFVCSKHFVGGHGPTAEHPDPLPYNQQRGAGAPGPALHAHSIGEPTGYSSQMDPNVLVKETKPNIALQQKPIIHQRTSAAMKKGNVSTQACSGSQQTVRAGQPRSRMTVPSCTVSVSGSPAKRLRLDTPVGRSQNPDNVLLARFHKPDVRQVTQMSAEQSGRREFHGPISQSTQSALFHKPKSASPRQSFSKDRNPKSHNLERAFLNPDHSAHLMTELSALWKSGKFVDAAILVGAVKLQAHRMVLFAASPYLRASFDQLDPSTELRLKMPKDIKLDAVFEFLTYIYDGVLKLNTENVLPLLKISLMLHVEHLTTCCEEFLSVAVKARDMDPIPDQDVKAPLLILVDTKPAGLGANQTDKCTQTVCNTYRSDQTNKCPQVEFERVFNDEEQSLMNFDCMTGSGVDVENPKDSQGAESTNIPEFHDSNPMPMMIIKNEFVDPEYELSLGYTHSGPAAAAVGDSEGHCAEREPSSDLQIHLPGQCVSDGLSQGNVPSKFLDPPDHQYEGGPGGGLTSCHERKRDRAHSGYNQDCNTPCLMTEVRKSDTTGVTANVTGSDTRGLMTTAGAVSSSCRNEEDSDKTLLEVFYGATQSQNNNAENKS